MKQFENISYSSIRDIRNNFAFFPSSQDSLACPSKMRSVKKKFSYNSRRTFANWHIEVKNKATFFQLEGSCFLSPPREIH
jgi:hypothetical protein